MARSKVKIGKPSAAPWRPPAPDTGPGPVFNAAPTAAITTSFQTQTGTEVPIFADSSSDSDGDPITYSFSLVSKPGGSAAVLVAGAASSDKKLTPDVAGAYLVRVTVTDDGGAGRGADPATPLADTKDCTVTAVAPAASIGGDDGTSTVESRLLSDPNVLWVATFDGATGAAAFGSGFDENDGRGGAFTNNVAYVATGANYGGQSAGLSMRVRHPVSHAEAGTGYGVYRRRRFGDLPDPLTPQRRAFLRYGVYLPASFNPYDGGKLPSFFGQPTEYALAGSAGMSSASVYNEYSWWAGIMWVGPSSMTGTWPNRTYTGDSNLDHIRFQCYIYAKQIQGTTYTQAAVNGGLRGYNIKSRAGLNQDPNVANAGGSAVTGTGAYLYMNRGAWNTVEQEVVINSVGAANGKYRLWLNDVLAINIQNIMWANDTYNVTAPVNCLMLDTFFGGPSGNATQQDVFLDDLVVSQQYVGPRGSA